MTSKEQEGEPIERENLGWRASSAVSVKKRKYIEGKLQQQDEKQSMLWCGLILIVYLPHDVQG
jgi:hypothetical protein